MDIQLEKLELIKQLLETTDESIIESLKKVFKSEKKDWWDELSDEQQDTINESMEEYQRGEFSSFDAFIKPHL
jgi:hypothetical protein